MQPAPSTPFNRPVGEGRCYAVVPMSFADLRVIRSALGGTLNDVVLSILAGGLGAYLREREQDTDGVELRAMIPVNVRSSGDKEALGNQVSMMIAPLPIGLTDAVERHKAVTSRLASLKEANQAGGFAILSRLTESVPANLQALAAMWTPATQPLFNVVCTNVPGPQVPLYVCGRQLQTLWPLLPLSMGLGLGVALTSYNGALYWGLTGDPELVPDIEETARCIESAFHELKLAAAGAG
jgi:WS/DGAT/MGAT family acyltransferase